MSLLYLYYGKSRLLSVLDFSIYYEDLPILTAVADTL